jgi:ankyrin repeat protein
LHGILGSTPLILAVTQVKDDESIRNRLIVLLLQAGADPNIGDRYGMTPLMHSILRRQKSTIRLLLESVEIHIHFEFQLNNLQFSFITETIGSRRGRL